MQSSLRTTHRKNWNPSTWEFQGKTNPTNLTVGGGFNVAKDKLYPLSMEKRKKVAAAAKTVAMKTAREVILTAMGWEFILGLLFFTLISPRKGK